MKSTSAYTTTFKSMVKKALIAIVFIVPLIAACTNYIFHPDQIRYSTPDEFGLDYKDIFLKTPDNFQIHGWFLTSTIIAKGTIFFLHGNAQNISSHINSVHWLPQKGYHVFLLDYRGYGDSTGSPTVRGVIDDINTGFAWLTQNPLVQKGPIYLLGQSMGASLGTYFVGSNPNVKNKLAGVILDAPFSNYSTIAHEKFNAFWLTWPFQYPLSMLFVSRFNPEDFIKNISPVPLLIMHSNEDKIIPSSHSRKLFRLAGTPKFFKQTRGGHITTFKFNKFRQEVLEFMARFAFLNGVRLKGR